ncbi:TetR/AcrR family transcriptional regulator [Liquorilactobacillus hordei]|uniref:TetR/AcrR family transcriptional regulator n=1 Tax=Liquorilactobacillus hordei TaxID=468911 RepID=UPI0039E82228
MNKNDTREKIIEVTIQKIRNENIQSFSIRSVVKTLNLTTGSFYKHFKNKNSLFLETAQRISQQIYNQVYPKIMDQEAYPQKALCVLGSELIDFFITEPKLADFLFFNPEVLDSYSVYSSNQHSFKLLTLTMKLINDLVNKENLQETSRTLFIQIWSFIQGYAILIKNQVTTKETSLIEHTLNELIRGK